jgi:hypothetical protein
MRLGCCQSTTERLPASRGAARVPGTVRIRAREEHRVIRIGSQPLRCVYADVWRKI